MKKLYTFLIALIAVSAVNAQCTIDTTQLAPGPGIYPSAPHLHHIVRDSLYDQTVIGRIQDTMSMNFGGFIEVSIRVDSVRLDSIGGLPVGISWVKNPDVLFGGHTGCVEFTGTTSDSAGTYNLRPIGMIWAHLKAPLLGLDKDTFSYGSLSQLPPWRNFYLVVDSVQEPLTVTSTTTNLCFGETGTGSATVFAAGGSATAPYTYLWNTGSTSYSLQNVNAGTYLVTVTSGSETATASVVVAIQPTPLALVMTTNGGSTGADGTGSVLVTGGVPPYNYFWNHGAGNNDSISGVAPGTYRVTVRDSFNCIASDTIYIADLSTGIATLLNGNVQVNIFPNPANTSLNVSIETQTLLSAKLEIMDLTGRIVYTSPVSASGKYNHTINLLGYSPGIYVLQLNAENQSLRQRFVISH
jgi:hypothetical protein